MKANKIMLYCFIIFLLILAYIVDGFQFSTEFMILIFASSLGLLINYIKSYYSKLLMPMTTVGSLLLVLFATAILGEHSPYVFIFYLFPITVAAFAYGIKGGLNLYFISLIFIYARNQYIGESYRNFLMESLILGFVSFSPIYISTQLNRLIIQNKQWLEMLHMKINEMSLLRDFTSYMQGATCLQSLDKIVLTTLTAGYGLGFNRALLFLVEGDEVYGEYAIGPSSKEEAYKVWGEVVTNQTNLHDVIKNHEDKDKSLLETVKNLRFNLKEDLENPIVKCCHEKSLIRMTNGDAKDFGSLMENLKFENYVLVPLITDNRIVGVFLVDNRFNEKEIADESVDTLITFAGTAALAFDNTMLSNNMKKLVITDELTQIYNHRHYKDSIEKLIKENSSFSLMVIDVDDFKQFNENYGHSTGDQILSEVGSIMKNAVGSRGLPFRYGGDEFTIIMPGAAREETLQVAKNIQEKINDLALEAVSSPLTISIGIADYPEDAKTESELFIMADRNLSFAKESGKNTVTWEVKS